MLFSLYTLSAIAGVAALLFCVALWGPALSALGDLSSFPIGPLLISTLWVHTTALVTAFPVAASLTYFYMIWRNTRRARLFSVVKDALYKIPFLLYGLIFFTVMGPSNQALILTFTLVAVAELTRRWVHVANRVQLVEIESLQALGMDIRGVVHVLILRRYLSLFLGHLLAVFCGLFVWVTPVLCFAWAMEIGGPLFSLHFLTQIFQEQPSAPVLALILLLVHGLRMLLDQKTGFWEVEHG
jgi:hypothetical protein